MDWPSTLAFDVEVLGFMSRCRALLLRGRVKGRTAWLPLPVRLFVPTNHLNKSITSDFHKATYFAFLFRINSVQRNVLVLFTECLYQYASTVGFRLHFILYPTKRSLNCINTIYFWRSVEKVEILFNIYWMSLSRPLHIFLYSPAARRP